MPRFSVLMPTHNRADIIGFAIKSVLAQTEQDFELIIVGDGCTDGTADVVAQHKDDRIRWLDLPKAPYSGYANRNYALRRALGQFVAYGQDDDLMLPDHLALIGKAMNSETDWAYSRPLWVTTDGIIVPYGTNLTIPGELNFFLDVQNTIPSCCVAHRRDCLDRFGFWPEDVPTSADWQLWRTIIRGCGRDRIAFVSMPTTLHFSAGWKNSRHSGMPEVLTWLNIIDNGGWWPEVLRHCVPENGQEQRVLFQAIQQGGQVFVSALRAAIDAVINYQAWDGILRIVPRLADVEAQLAEREAALKMMTAEATQVKAQLAGRESDLKMQKDEVAHLNSALAKKNDLLREAIDAAASLRTQLNAILASRTWRVMEPVRRLRRLLARLEK
jgi:hypothetical protein